MGRRIIRTGPIRVVVAALYALAGIGLFSAAAPAASGKKSHGLSAFGELKYGVGFKHFDYVNPKAPKGGTIRLRGIEERSQAETAEAMGRTEDAVRVLYWRAMKALARIVRNSRKEV